MGDERKTLKHRSGRGLTADLYFWRHSHGIEVDLVFGRGQWLQSVKRGLWVMLGTVLGFGALKVPQ